MGLCGCHLQEKLKCSNGIHDGQSWHRVCINISRERHKICRIVAIKITGKVLCSGEIGCLCCPWKACHQFWTFGHDWWNETHTRDMNLKTFHNICSEATWNWNSKMLQWINLNGSFRHYYIHYEDSRSFSVGFLVAGLDHTKFGFYQFQSFLFIVVIGISILLKTTFWQISIHSQLLVKML